MSGPLRKKVFLYAIAALFLTFCWSTTKVVAADNYVQPSFKPLSVENEPQLGYNLPQQEIYDLLKSGETEKTLSY